MMVETCEHADASWGHARLGLTRDGRFLYNDTSYLAERLAAFSAAWKARDDLSVRAKAMLRLDNDVKTLQNFANRAYSNENEHPKDHPPGSPRR